MPTTSLTEIAVRTTTVWGGLRTRPYSMGGAVPRNDCSSFVAEVLGLANPLAWSTVNLPQVLTPITFDQALPGDVWGKLGPGTAGSAGHVAIITGTPRTRGDTRWEVVEQSGPTGVPGPARNVYKKPPAGYRAYRSKYVTSVLPTPPTVEEDMPIYARTTADQTVWVSDGLRRRPISLGASVLGTVRYVANEAALNDMCGPADSQAVKVELTPEQLQEIEDAAREGAEAGAPSAKEIADAVVDEEHSRLAE